MRVNFLVISGQFWGNPKSQKMTRFFEVNFGSTRNKPEPEKL